MPSDRDVIKPTCLCAAIRPLCKLWPEVKSIHSSKSFITLHDPILTIHCRIPSVVSARRPIDFGEVLKILNKLNATACRNVTRQQVNAVAQVMAKVFRRLVDVLSNKLKKRLKLKVGF